MAEPPPSFDRPDRLRAIPTEEDFREVATWPPLTEQQKADLANPAAPDGACAARDPAPERPGRQDAPPSSPDAPPSSPETGADRMTETETEAADRDSSIRLARFALAAHIKGSPGAAVEAVETLYVHFGGRGLVCALATWADAWHHHASAGQATTVSGPPSILDRETGDEWDPADPSVPDDVAWATQLVYAYCKNDDDRFFGLIRELIDAKDSEKASRHVQTVLALVSGSIRNLPAGFGLLLNDRPGVMS